MSVPVCPASTDNLVNVEVVDGVLCVSLQAHHVTMRPTGYEVSQNPGGVQNPAGFTSETVGTGTFSAQPVSAGEGMCQIVQRTGVYLITGGVTLDNLSSGGGPVVGTPERSYAAVTVNGAIIAKSDPVNTNFPDQVLGEEGTDHNVAVTRLLGAGSRVCVRQFASHVEGEVLLNHADPRNYGSITLISDHAN